MKILVVGGGGREHTIIKKIKENSLVKEIFALPGNGGMADDATCVNIGATELDKIVEFAVDNKIDYAIVAPDDPLVLGLVDLLEEKGIPCFGPRKNAAIIEGSKVFSKNLMKKYNIPTAKYEVFSNVEKAMEPLFTTSQQEERAGLGFTVMQSFMDRVKVKSTPNKGTTVTLEKQIISVR